MKTQKSVETKRTARKSKEIAPVETTFELVPRTEPRTLAELLAHDSSVETYREINEARGETVKNMYAVADKLKCGDLENGAEVLSFLTGELTGLEESKISRFLPSFLGRKVNKEIVKRTTLKELLEEGKSRRQEVCASLDGIADELVAVQENVKTCMEYAKVNIARLAEEETLLETALNEWDSSDELGRSQASFKLLEVKTARANAEGFLWDLTTSYKENEAQIYARKELATNIRSTGDFLELTNALKLVKLATQNGLKRSVEQYQNSVNAIRGLTIASAQQTQENTVKVAQSLYSPVFDEKTIRDATAIQSKMNEKLKGAIKNALTAQDKAIAASRECTNKLLSLQGVSAEDIKKLPKKTGK